MRTNLSGAYTSHQPGVLRPAVAPDRCMDVPNNYRHDGAMLVIWNCFSSENQLFRWDTDGRLRVFNTDVRCVTDQSGAGVYDALIVIASCDGRPGQQWVPTADGSGIQLVGTGRCIEVPAGAIHLALRDCHAGISQRWGVPNTNLSGAYTLGHPVVLRPAVAPDRCMDVPNNYRHDGAMLVIWNCFSSENQLFRWDTDGRLRVFNTDVRCVTDGSGVGAYDALIVTASCDGRPGQRWAPTADGTGIQLAGTGRCIQVPDGAIHLALRDCHGGANQRWDVPTRLCGVSFTAVVTDEDALLASYGIPVSTDTVHVCESWTGSDYVVRETVTGRAPNAFREPEAAQTVIYSGGQISGYATDGTPAHEVFAAGPTAFDLMQVDAAGRQAASDNPYYAVYASAVYPSEDSPCGGTIRCSVQSVADTVAASGPRRSAAPDTGNAARKFSKHGLKRRGVRALVEDAEEVGRSPDGHRRFKQRRGDGEVTFTLDKETELLVGEETTTPLGSTRAKHAWKKDTKGNYVRDRTEVESVETVAGRPLRSRTTITLVDLTLNTDDVSPASPSTLRLRTPR